jgi:hypothetical protein
LTLFALGFLFGTWLAITRQEAGGDHFKSMLDSFPWRDQNN